MSISYGERSDTSATSRLGQALDTTRSGAVVFAAATVAQEKVRRRMARRVVDEKQWGEIRNG